MTPQDDLIARQARHLVALQHDNERLKERVDRLFVALAALLAFCAAHEREAIVQARCSWLVKPDGDPIASARIALQDVVGAHR